VTVGEPAGDDAALTCPSGRCHTSASLIGLVGSDGRVSFVSPALPLSDDFVARASRYGGTDHRFRFAEPCAKASCEQWTSNRCGLIDELVVEDPNPPDRLPKCGIRSSCRWFAQHAGKACAVCPDVLRRPSVLQSNHSQTRSVGNG
jgi:hypothetical protein